MAKGMDPGRVEIRVPIALSVECALRNPRINGATCLCLGAVTESVGRIGAGETKELVWPEIYRCDSCGGARFDKGE